MGPMLEHGADREGFSYWTLWPVVNEEDDGWMMNGARRVGAQIISLKIEDIGAESHDRASPWNTGGRIFIFYPRDDQNNNTVT